MTSKTIKTEDRIIAKALEMFNEKGIEYVGMRELAAVLHMRVSNITYYFPTKDDLVNRLSLDLYALNSKTLVDQKDLTMRSFLDTFVKVFRNHMQYRCLPLSFVHLMTQNKLISERYAKTQETRNRTIRSNLSTLIKTGYLKKEVENDLEFLVSTIALFARFWISEGMVSFPHLSPEEQIRHYTTSLAKFLVPYSTEKGRGEIEGFIKQR